MIRNKSKLILGIALSLFLFLFIHIASTYSNLIWTDSVRISIMFLTVPFILVVVSLLPYFIFKRPIRTIASFYNAVFYGPLVSLLVAVFLYFYFQSGAYHHRRNTNFAQLEYLNESRIALDKLEDLEGTMNFKIVATEHNVIDTLDRELLKYGVLYRIDSSIKIFKLLLTPESKPIIIEHHLLRESASYEEYKHIIETYSSAIELIDT